MWDTFLELIGMGEPRVDSSGQLRKAQAAQKAPATKATPEQERKAKAAGFPSYEAMIQFQRQKEMQRGKTTTTEKPSDRSKRATNPMEAHPKSIFEYIADALSGAGGGN